MVKQIDEGDNDITPEERKEKRRQAIRKEMYDRLEINIPTVPDKEKAPGWGRTLWNATKSASVIVPTIAAGAAIAYANDIGQHLDKQDEPLDSIPRAILNTIDKGAAIIGPTLALIPGGQLAGAALTAYAGVRKALATPVLGSAIRYGADTLRGAPEKSTIARYNEFLERDALMQHTGFF